MKAIAPVAPVAVELIDGQPTTTSLDVAAHFSKLHKDVLRAVRSLECSPEFHERNFAPIQIDVDLGMGRSRKDQAFRMTRDGFTFLCMGFTGKEAAKWKEAYISAFNQLEHTLKHGAPVKPKRQPKQLTDGLSADQQASVRALVKARIEALPQNKQAKAAITCWSALKSKFGCTYKDIDPAQFAEALSLVARLALEGELLAPEPAVPALHYPPSLLLELNPHLRSELSPRQLALGVRDLCGNDNRSATLQLLAELERAGHRIDGCRLEIQAMRHHLERYWDTCRLLDHSAERGLHQVVSITLD